MRGRPLDRRELPASWRVPAERRAETGETLITLVSDDDFRATQHTLLLLFALRQ